MPKMPLTKYDNMVKAVAPNRSAFHNSHSAMVIAARSADPECPSPEDVG
jgi:hypothetical protein